MMTSVRPIVSMTRCGDMTFTLVVLANHLFSGDELAKASRSRIAEAEQEGHLVFVFFATSEAVAAVEVRDRKRVALTSMSSGPHVLRPLSLNLVALEMEMKSP